MEVKRGRDQEACGKSQWMLHQNAANGPESVQSQQHMNGSRFPKVSETMRARQERIKVTEKASPIHTLFHR